MVMAFELLVASAAEPDTRRAASPVDVAPSRSQRTAVQRVRVRCASSMVHADKFTDRLETRHCFFDMRQMAGILEYGPTHVGNPLGMGCTARAAGTVAMIYRLTY